MPARTSRSSAAAVDESPDVVRPWVDEAHATYPVLVDADHEFVDAYGIRNVPTVVWVDENDRIVRPNSPEFGDDQFIDFHGQPSAPHLEALERWIINGEKPYHSDNEVRAEQFLPDYDQQLARRSTGWPSSCGAVRERTSPNNIRACR